MMQADERRSEYNNQGNSADHRLWEGAGVALGRVEPKRRWWWADGERNGDGGRELAIIEDPLLSLEFVMGRG